MGRPQVIARLADSRYAVALDPDLPAAQQQVWVIDAHAPWRGGGGAVPAASLFTRDPDWEFLAHPDTALDAALRPFLPGAADFYSEDQERDDHGRWTSGGGTVDPILRERAPSAELLADREDRKSRTVGEAAALNSMTVEDYKRAVEANLQRLAAESQIRVQMPESALAKILKDDRFKTAFETRSPQTRQAGYQKARAGVEADIFSLTASSPKDQHPVYGVLATPGVGGDESMTRGYGTVAVELAASVKDRTTFQVDDSMGYNNQLPSPLAAPHWASADYRYIPEERGRDPLHLKDASSVQGAAYIETQTHGGVKVSDIKRVVFDGPPPAALTQALDRKGIAYAHFDSQTEAYPYHAPVPAAEIGRLEKAQGFRRQEVEAYSDSTVPSLQRTASEGRRLLAATEQNLARYRAGER